MCIEEGDQEVWRNVKRGERNVCVEGIGGIFGGREG